MGSIKLFRIGKDSAIELEGQAVALEKSLQSLMEKNLDSLLGVGFLASEYSTGKKHGGRIDTLGIDENGSPVIIEYKRAANENVINQGLFYLDWLMDHKAEFQLLVMQRFKKQSEDIDWSAPRLLCIAGDFTRYDEHAVQQMNRTIELIRYRRFADDLLLLETVNAVSVVESGQTGGGTAPAKDYKLISETLAELQPPLSDLYEELRAYLVALGDDVVEKTTRFYVAFRRLKNFACVDVRPSKGNILIYLKVDPANVELEKDFTRDVRKVGHYGTGDLEVTVQGRNDLDRAKPLIESSYEAS